MPRRLSDLLRVVCCPREQQTRTTDSRIRRTSPSGSSRNPDAHLGLEHPASPDARYEQREGVELAFIAALQHLPARQRAVLILRDVLGFSARETAEVLDSTQISIDSALQRAHKTVDERLRSQSQQQTARLLGDNQLRQLVERYVTAWERNDVDAVVSVLVEDARMTMPPLPSWYSGREQVAAFLRGHALAEIKRWQADSHIGERTTRAGGYLWDGQTEAFMPYCLDVTHCGPVVPAADLDRLFQPFQRVAAATGWAHHAARDWHRSAPMRPRR